MVQKITSVFIKVTSVPCFLSNLDEVKSIRNRTAEDYDDSKINIFNVIHKKESKCGSFVNNAETFSTLYISLMIMAACISRTTSASGLGYIRNLVQLAISQRVLCFRKGF